VRRCGWTHTRREVSMKLPPVDSTPLTGNLLARSSEAREDQTVPNRRRYLHTPRACSCQEPRALLTSSDFAGSIAASIRGFSIVPCAGAVERRGCGVTVLSRTLGSGHCPPASRSPSQWAAPSFRPRGTGVHSWPPERTAST